LHPAAAARDATNMPLHLRWQSRAWLMSLSLVALGPAVALWAAAFADSIGITHLLTYLPMPAAATSRPERLLLLDTFRAVTLVLPLVAVLSGVLATVSFDLRIGNWEITARVRLPAPPWTLRQVIAAVLRLVGASLFVAMAGHLAADCVLGADCVSI
jgi:hypothetical protein